MGRGSTEPVEQQDIDRLVEEVRGLRADLQAFMARTSVPLAPMMVHQHEFMSPNASYCRCGARYENGVWMTGSFNQFAR